jgi:hypothetical protein
MSEPTPPPFYTMPAATGQDDFSINDVTEQFDRARDAVALARQAKIDARQAVERRRQATVRQAIKGKKGKRRTIKKSSKSSTVPLVSVSAPVVSVSAPVVSVSAPVPSVKGKVKGYDYYTAPEQVYLPSQIQPHPDMTETYVVFTNYKGQPQTHYISVNYESQPLLYTVDVDGTLYIRTPLFVSENDTTPLKQPLYTLKQSQREQILRDFVLYHIKKM